MTNGTKNNNVAYRPKIQDVKCKIEPSFLKFRDQRLYRVISLPQPDTLELDTGLKAKLLGIKLKEEKINNVVEYMNKYVLRKEVFLKFDRNAVVDSKNVQAYVYLKNRIFINAYLLKLGLAVVDSSMQFDQKNKFMSLCKTEE